MEDEFIALTVGIGLSAVACWSMLQRVEWLKAVGKEPVRNFPFKGYWTKEIPHRKYFEPVRVVK